MTAWTEGTSPARTGASASGAGALLLGVAALQPLFVDLSWVPPVVVVVVVVALLGVVLRSLQVPLALVVLLQLAGVACVVTLLFTSAGVLGVLPGPAALEQVRGLLEGAGSQIRDEAVPVTVSPELTALVVLLVGAAAAVVDGLVAGLQAPATAGLVLLAVVAVPASLLDESLPWWSFVLGALALVLLLVADGPQRTPRAGPAAGSAGLRSPALLGVLVVALVVGLLGGSAVTGVGTEGRLASSGSGGGVGLNPFTQLQGQLDQPQTARLFTVRGLDAPTYLRSLALDTYVPNQGWVLGQVTADQSADGALDDGGTSGTPVQVLVTPQRYTDRWLPSPGTPVEVRGQQGALSGYRYDRSLSTLFTDAAQPLPAYSVQAVVPEADAASLRATGTPGEGAADAPDARFYATGGIDPRVARITADLVPAGSNPLDAAVLLTTYFRDPANGFTYDLSTAAGSGSDALVDFLTNGRRGFCEQFASAMAAMLRTQGIPTRVAVGFTAGTGDATERQITTDDAHAWVEVYFSGVGWVQFDPTPLTDGRGVVPDYVTQAQADAGQAAAPTSSAAPTPSAAPAPSAGADAVAPGQQADGSPADPTATEVPLLTPTRVLVPLAVLVVLAVLLVGPRALRLARRRARLADADPGRRWDEVLDTLGDHGVALARSETPRSTAERAVAELGLDEETSGALRELVDAVEQDWYSAGGTTLRTRHTPAAALALVRSGVAVAAPVGVRGRWLPASLRGSVGASSTTPD